MRYKLTAVNLYGKTEMAMGQLWLPLLPGCNRTIVRVFNGSAELPGKGISAAGRGLCCLQNNCSGLCVQRRESVVKIPGTG